VYLVSVTRGKVPSGALLLAQGEAETASQAARLDALRGRIEASNPSDLKGSYAIARDCWATLGFTVGQRSWDIAGSVLAPYIVSVSRGRLDSIEQVRQEIDALRGAYLVSEEREDEDLVQVMTLNQTKGRESDATIVWCRGDDYFGSVSDWSVNGRRLLYVALTRARNEISVLLAPDAHALWSPLAALAVAPETATH
jgi:superfamily I DNA/RNA helicase